MLDERSLRRFSSVALAFLMIGSVVGVGGVESAAANAGFAVTTESATNVTDTGATLRGNLTGLDGADSATVYVTYWKSGQKEETLTWWTGDAKSSPGPFGADVTLDAGTTYEYRAYAKSADGTWKAGSVREVTTEGEQFGVETGDATDVTSSAATVNGDLTGLGGADSATVYVKYWPKGDSSTAYWWTGDDRTSPGSFETALDLRAGTSYEYRALARSADGEWTAGAVESFTTDGNPFEVSTPLPENVTHDSAEVGARLHGLGGADSATVYVKYWEEGRESETSTWWTGPTASDPGEYETTLSDLTAETTYVVRAFARDDAGDWKAGKADTFTTEGEPGDGEPPHANYEVRLISETDDFENARPLDSEDTVTFNASESWDPDGEVVDYEWDFDGDGTTDATGEVVTHSFPDAGDYPVRVTVTDDDGNSRSYEREVRVGEKIADTIYAVNAGGPRLYEGHGDDAVGHPNWAADTESDPSQYANHDASGSRVLEADSNIDGHDVEEPPIVPNSMYETVREAPADGESMRYSFDVEADRTYEVRVFFTEVEINETDYEQGQRRIFDVTVDGQTLVDDLDTYGERGHDGGGSESLTATADDGTLTVEFQREQGDPVVSGIEILRVEEGTESSDG